MNSTNKIALVTGGSRGLGKDMALNLAKKGFDVVITFNNKKDDALEVVRQIEKMGQKAATIQLNVGKTAEFDAFISQLKTVLSSHFGAEKIDFLINNAGVGGHVSFADTDEMLFDELMNVHLKGVFFLTQKLLAHFNDGGGIVNISSGLTRLIFPGYDAYATMKTAVEGLTKYWAKGLGARKIRVNVVAPGAIETDFGGGAVRDNAELNAYLASVTALGRVGLPTDIGSVVAFLCTDDAFWVNAQRIEVSGGQMI